MSYSISLSGHGDTASASVYHGSYPHNKSASYSGVLEEVAEKSVAFIRQCQQEEAEREAAQPDAAVDSESQA